MQKIVCPSCLFCNFHTWGSLKLWEKYIEHQLGGEYSHRILPFNQTDTNTWSNEIVLVTPGSRTGEFIYKWK